MGATVDDLEKLGLGQAVPATAFFDRDGDLVGRVLECFEGMTSNGVSSGCSETNGEILPSH